MGAAQRQLKRLFQSGARGDPLFVLTEQWFTHRETAAFLYVAEQYGYQYCGFAPGHSPMRRSHPFALRRLPDAPQRAAHTAAAYPQAVRGGQLPGMRPGGRALTPLPEVRPQVDLLFARIMVDVTSRPYRWKRVQLAFAAAMTEVVLFFASALLLTSSLGSMVTKMMFAAGGVGMLTLIGFGVGEYVSRRWHAKYRHVLEEAGVAWYPSYPAPQRPPVGSGYHSPRR